MNNVVVKKAELNQEFVSKLSPEVLNLILSTRATSPENMEKLKNYCREKHNSK